MIKSSRCPNIGDDFSCLYAWVFLCYILELNFLGFNIQMNWLAVDVMQKHAFRKYKIKLKFALKTSIINQYFLNTVCVSSFSASFHRPQQKMCLVKTIRWIIKNIFETSHFNKFSKSILTKINHVHKSMSFPMSGIEVGCLDNELPN